MNRVNEPAEIVGQSPGRVVPENAGMRVQPHFLSVCVGGRLRWLARCGVAGALGLVLAWGLPGWAQPEPVRVALTSAEQAYVQRHPEFTLCVDPDWVPFERINERGEHEGMGADLVQLVAERVGLRPRLHVTRTWEESLAASKSGECQAMSFLNQTPEREQWLRFTSPLFSDPNVLITREEHPYIAELGGLSRHVVALPKGTMVAERFRSAYPHIQVVLTESEDQAVQMVANREVDLTIRSLVVAAYTIRKQGLFTLKVAGQVPDLHNHLRIGVRLDQPQLLAVLDKGARSLTLQDRERVLNHHVNINIPSLFNWRRALPVLAGVAIVLLGALALGAWWIRQTRRLAEQRVALIERRLHQEQRNREIQARLVAMLSHEIRTPLAAIDGAAQSLEILLPYRNEQVQVRLDRIRHGVQRILQLSEQFLNKDRVDQGALQLKPVPLNPSELCSRVVGRVGDDRIRLTTEPGPSVVADADMLHIALDNLLRNALKYAPADSPVSVAQRFQGATWSVAVRNPGAIDPDAVGHIFQPYVRATTSTDVAGAGLGLYLVSRVAALHQGDLALTQNADGWVEFTLTLPQAPSGVSSAFQA